MEGKNYKSAASNILYSTNLKIGGRTYNAYDASRLSTPSREGAASFKSSDGGGYNGESKAQAAGDTARAGAAAQKAGSGILQKAIIESQVSIHAELSKDQSKPASILNTAGSYIGNSGRDLLNKAQSGLAKNGDMGTQTASTSISAGMSAYSVFKAAQGVSPIAVNTVKGAVGTVRGAWDASSTLVKSYLTVSRTAGFIQTGVVPFNSQALSMLKLQAHLTGLNKTALSKAIIHRIKAVKNKVAKIKTGIVTASRMIKKVALTSYTIVKGVASGKMNAAVTRAAINSMKNAVVSGLKTGTVKSVKALGKGAAQAAAKSGAWALHKGIPRIKRYSDKGASNLSKTLAKSDNVALQGIGGAISLSRYGVKTAVFGSKVTYKTVRTSTKVIVKTAKKTWHTFKYIKNKGLRNAYHHARQKAAKAVYNAGKSVVTAVINIIRALGMKIAIPLILIAAVVAGGTSIVSAPVSVIASLFGGIFSIFDGGSDYVDYDIRDYLSNPSYGIPALRDTYINNLVTDLTNRLESNGGGYDYVRFYTSEDTSTQISCTYPGVNSVFYNTEQIINIVQPIMNAALVMDYDLTPSEQQAKTLMKDIFDSIFSTVYTDTVEHCGQAPDGTYTTHTCGNVHALPGCPNVISGTHSSYTCSSCCSYYYTCDGHSGSHSATCYNNLGQLICTSDHTWYHSGNMSSPCSNSTQHFTCSGYSYCGGHDVLSVTLNMDGVYGLLQKYFTDPIDQLANLAIRTEEEEERLQTLKDYYELCLEYINEINIGYGGALTMNDISGVTWVNGSRSGNQAIIDLALLQVGQTGGQPYWSWYGFSSRVEWCACFVSWCINQKGYSEPKFSSCQYGGVPYFQSNGQWQPGGFTDLAPGDVIFFDWDCNGAANHVGLVIGRDDTNVYTVEGNSGDACRIKAYPMDSTVILGYGLMNY